MVHYKGKPCKVLLADGDRMVIVDRKGKSYYIKRNELDMCKKTNYKGVT